MGGYHAGDFIWVSRARLGGELLAEDLNFWGKGFGEGNLGGEES